MIKNRLIGYTLIIISILLPVINYHPVIYRTIANKKEIKSYINKTSINNQEDTNKSNYIAVLEIPEINLTEGLVSQDSPYNNIKYNIEILDGSTFPNQTNSILFLAAHNGNSPVSYFKNLEKLTKNSKIYLFYNGNKYEYLIDTFYTVSKIGKVSINNDKAKTTIVLISCKNNSDTEQVVYIGYLERKVEY